MQTVNVATHSHTSLSSFVSLLRTIFPYWYWSSSLKEQGNGMPSSYMMDSKQKDIFVGSSGSRSHPAFLSSSENIYKLKVVLIGDVSVGKTSLAVRFTQDKFEEHYKQTIGASFISKIAIVKSDVIHFQIWDTAGQERYKSLVPMYLRGAHIAFIIYDITDPGSFANISFWLDALQHHCDMVTTVLVANKCDLPSVIDELEALSFAQEHGIQFVTTSARSGYNVECLFHSIGSKVVDKMKNQAAASTGPLLSSNRSIQVENSDEKVKTGKCCKR